MVPIKSLDASKLVIAAMLRDVYNMTFGSSFIEQSISLYLSSGSTNASAAETKVLTQFYSDSLQVSLYMAAKGIESDLCLVNVKHCSKLVKAMRINARNLRLTLQKVNKRLEKEGMSFLTKTLPRLGKALDRALSSENPLDVSSIGFKTIKGTNLPRFLGEFFGRIFDIDGRVLPSPCVNSVRIIRQIAYLYYKYELPYNDEQEQHVVSEFERTEDDLSASDSRITSLTDKTATYRHRTRGLRPEKGLDQEGVTRKAKILLAELFGSFDPRNISPRHGPGAVATRQRPWSKYLWENVSKNITDYYPLDAYFYASNGHVCDSIMDILSMSEVDLPARVCLVPKDSRGPRLISCEPVDYQWVQQGLGRAIVELVESHCLTKYNVHYTDQGPNQRGAWLGSKLGTYATLDLKEASDRVSLELVRLLFPEHLMVALEACRSSSTELPNGKLLKLRKFAPMGSSLCFPILALTIWAILTAAAPDTDTRESILVYGDDVIVPTAFAVDAMEQLESFGLKINRDKSCISGLFRESCGYDAFAGESVTPVRLRTVWSSARRADVYTSYIEYSNNLFARGFVETAEQFAEWLITIYGEIPSKDSHIDCPSLLHIPPEVLERVLAKNPKRALRKRTNPALQKRETYVLDVFSPKTRRVLPGWSMLLRFFTEKNDTSPWGRPELIHDWQPGSICSEKPVSVSLYTERRRSILRRCWR